jgi:hypothetical protein
MPTLKTLDITSFEHKERVYSDKLMRRWLEHAVWLRDMAAKYDNHSLIGSRYLYKDDAMILMATVGPSGLELWLGWTVRDNEAYYWSLFAACLELFGEQYFVTADIDNAAIWIR